MAFRHVSSTFLDDSLIFSSFFLKFEKLNFCLPPECKYYLCYDVSADLRVSLYWESEDPP